jgi:acyl-CoA-binding protein
MTLCLFFPLLFAATPQATQGDNTAERPMWAEKGGLDFEGRARWDAWTNIKGMAVDKAKMQFVKSYYEFPPSVLYSDTRASA